MFKNEESKTDSCHAWISTEKIFVVSGEVKEANGSVVGAQAHLMRYFTMWAAILHATEFY